MLVASSVLRRSIAWLCLALALLLSVTPRQGFVLCIEADGCVSVAPSLEREHCDGCEPHERELAARTSDVDAAGRPACACLDVEVPGAGEPKRVIEGSARECELNALVTLAARMCLGLAPSWMVDTLATDRSEPRPPPLHEHVASVVLRV